ncbi:MAG: prepilin-type N-terminal cleavage/methylation domain-containing protein [Desulfuromonadaceae bacterium]|nr:prepilin-type N-terminal cleavage/methylation domain-containing protein [Desulfuromonadaceae bacterium]
MKYQNLIIQAKREDGFTLVEVLIALAISGLFLTAVYASFKSQQESYLAQDQVAEVQQNIRAGVGMMIQELRMAGFDPYRSKTVGIETAEQKKIVFTLLDDLDLDGKIDEDEIRKISYELYDAYTDGVMAIGRQVGDSASTKRAVAENIQELEFLYLDSDGDIVSWDDIETDPNKKDEIRSVRISVLARVGQPDQKFVNSETYTSASGAVWGPYNDHLRRRFQIVTVQLRNLE